VVEIRRYITRAGQDVVGEWLAELKDLRSRAKISIRIDRLASGNFGDYKSLGHGLYELRIDSGPGYRLYYAMEGKDVRFAALRWKQEQAINGHRTGEKLSQRLSGEDGTMKRAASISHDEAIVRELRRNPKFAAEYLKAALEDEDEPRVLLIALRHLAQAQGIAKVAKAAGIERESLYRALSAKGNPRLSTLVAVTRAIGLKLTVEAA
jgi:probable addiction module antidote protein/putative addiction module killer protein